MSWLKNYVIIIIDVSALMKKGEGNDGFNKCKRN
jgi:hypothetical protein